jgi:hypothetical protein
VFDAAFGRLGAGIRAGMNSCSPFRRSAIRYWEWRRIFYNVALVPSALIGYGVTDVVNHVGDLHNSNNARLFVWFVLAAVGANICYTFTYALEFFFGSDDPNSRWLRHGRISTFLGGVLLAILLALIGGRDIANLDFYYEVRSLGHLG